MRAEQPPTQTPSANRIAHEFVVACHLSCVTCRASFVVEEFVAEFVPFVNPAEYAIS